MDSQGVIYCLAYDLGHGYTELHVVDPATGQLSHLLDIDNGGIGAIAFGPGDTLYASINLYYPAGVAPNHLVTIDMMTGVTTVIGKIAPAPAQVQTLNFDGTTMYAWGFQRGLMTVNLNTGLGTVVDPNFVGNGVAMCFGDDGTLFVVDSNSYWLTEPTTGVPSFVGFTSHNILGNVEYISGPNQVLSLWQTGLIGEPSEIKVRGATPNGDVALFASVGPPGTTTTIPLGSPCAGTVLNLEPSSVRFLKAFSTDTQGELTLGPTIFPPQIERSFTLQALDLQTCITSNPIRAAW